MAKADSAVFPAKFVSNFETPSLPIKPLPLFHFSFPACSPSTRTRSRARDAAQQLRKGISLRALGTPNEDTWPGVSKLKPPRNFYSPEEEPQGLGTLVPRINDEPDGKDLLSKLLCLNPEGRISAEQALKHAYFADPEGSCRNSGI